MNIKETIKEKTLRLIGLVLITIPLIASYTTLRLFDLSARIATIATVCLSGIAYFILVIYFEPFLRRMLSLTPSETQSQFLAARLKDASISSHGKKGPLYTGMSELDFDLPNLYALRGRSGTWIH